MRAVQKDFRRCSLNTQGLHQMVILPPTGTAPEAWPDHFGSLLYLT